MAIRLKTDGDSIPLDADNQEANPGGSATSTHHAGNGLQQANDIFMLRLVLIHLGLGFDVIRLVILKDNSCINSNRETTSRRWKSKSSVG